MLCEKCKQNNATLFYEENINGKKRSLALCSSCASELEKSGELPKSSSLSEEFIFSSPFSALHDSLFGSLFGIPSKNAEIEKGKTCPVCNSTFESFRSRGKAGCATCYSTFSSELYPLIRSIHGNAKHSGRAPVKFSAKREKENTLRILKKQLKDAIANEEYEKAASLRDNIRSIEGRN